MLRPKFVQTDWPLNSLATHPRAREALRRSALLCLHGRKKIQRGYSKRADGVAAVVEGSEIGSEHSGRFVRLRLERIVSTHRIGATESFSGSPALTIIARTA